MFIRRTICVGYAVFLSYIIASQSASAFIVGEESTWTNTASGPRSGNGVAGTLTWSIVPDGTNVVDGLTSLGGSELNAFLGDTFTGQKSGLDLIGEALGRWDELSGLTFVYEPNDDGGNHTDKRGILGVRGDIRMAGASIDGDGGTLAFNYFPSGGADMVWDTDDGGDFGNSSNNYRFLRNTIMHEIGHGLGLSHVNSDSDRLLLEPFIDTRFDGPQLDEVRAIQFYFGDAYEADNDGAGNGTIANASNLGQLETGNPIAIGEDADVPRQAIAATATDFVSISNNGDLDFFSFTVSEYSSLNAALTPLGGTFTQTGGFGSPTSFNADARSDLSFSLIAEDGTTILGTADSTDAGEAESLSSMMLSPGTYYTRIEGAEDTIQLYMLELELSGLPGDYNQDGVVDAADFTVWRDFLGDTVSPGTSADGNLDGLIDGSDYQLWFDNFGTDYRGATGAAIASVPEPHSGMLLLVFTTAMAVLHRRRRG